MRVAGLLLLLSGWGIVLAAIALLPGGTGRGMFLASGMLIEALGLGFALRGAGGAGR